MPFISLSDDPRQFTETPDLRTAPIGDAPSPSLGATAGASFRQNNPIVSALANRDASAADRYRIDDGFDLFEQMKADGLQGQEDAFLDVFNRKAYDARKAQVAMETEDRRTLDASGVWGDLTNLGASVADPTILLPAGEIGVGARSAAMLGRTALRVGGAAAIGTAIQETELQQSQQLRTGKESAFAIGGSALLGGLLGAGAGAWLSRGEARTASEAIDRTANTDVPDVQAANEAMVSSMLGEPSSAGAAAVRMSTLDENTIAGRAAGAVNKASAWARLNPLVRLMESPSAIVRSVANGMMENPLYLKKNLEGVASDPAVETLVKEFSQGAVGGVLEQTDAAYKAFRKAGGPLSKDEFRDAVGMAMRRDDKDPNPHIAAAAQAWRAKVFDPLKQQAIDAGLLPADVDVSTAASYFSRMWNGRKIEANEGRFRGIVSDWVQKTVKAEVDRLTQNKEARVARVQQEMNDLQLPAPERAKLLESLPADLKQLKAGHPLFDVLDTSLADTRSKEFAARQAAKDASSPQARVAARAEAEAHAGRIKDITDKAGKDYADYVTKRNVIATRLRHVRNNIVGREDQVERLRAQMADAENANVDRLWRLHRSLSGLEGKLDQASPEVLQAELSKARTDFAKVLDRSNKAQERLSKAKLKAKEDAFETGEAAKAQDVDDEQTKREYAFLFAEQRRLDEMAKLSDEITRLEDIDPEEAVSQLRMLVERRLDQAADVVEQSTKRMMALAERLKGADPEIVKTRVEELRGRLSEIERKYDDRVDIGLDGANGHETYVNDIVDSIYNQLTGHGDTAAPRDIVPTKRGPLKERTFNIPDKLVEDFLESDVEMVGRRYARTMAGEIELARKFGSPDMKETFNSIEQDYAKRRAEVAASDAEPKAKEKALVKLNKKERADKRDLAAIRDMLRGTYLPGANGSGFARALSVANTFNYLRSMGGVVLSSITDVARPIMIHGLGRYMNDGIRPLVTNLKAVKMSVKEAKLAGTVAEKILNTRMSTWAEITDPYSHGSPFERFMENTAKRFSQANGMVYWNDWMKSFASVMTQNRVLGNVTKFDSINGKEKAYLAFLGIDEDMAKRIGAEFEAHGHNDDGVMVAGTEDWTDAVARRAYRAAINKDVDSIIVTKGVGDTPLFSHTPVGRAVLQFKSFSLASHQRAFMRGLQGVELGVDGGRAGQLAGLVSSTAIGMFIYYMKAVESNRVDQLSDNPGHWIGEGLDRSGLMAIPFEINNTVEKGLGVGAYGALQRMFPDKQQSGPASRYATRSVAASLTGPTGDFVDTLVRVANGVQRRDANGNYVGLKDSDIAAIRRLVPFANLPGIKSALAYGIDPAPKPHP